MKRTAMAMAFTCLLVSPTLASALAPGDLDPTFADNGAAHFSWGSGPAPASGIKAVALQQDGKIVIGGFATDRDGHDAFLVARLGANGLPDSTFGDHGRVIVQLGVPAPDQRVSSEVSALALQPDGKIVAGGSATRADGAGFLVARLTAAGQFDSRFGDNGVVELPPRGLSSDPTLPGGVSAIALQPDGKVVTAGGLSFSLGVGAGQVTRLTAGGQPDSEFGDQGLVNVFPSGATRHSIVGGHAIALQDDGKILFAGVGPDPWEPTYTAALLVRLTTGGVPDSTFAEGGTLSYQPLPEGELPRWTEGNSVAVLQDGRIVLAGSAMRANDPGRMLVAQFSGDDGSLDPSFADGGRLLARVPGGSSLTPEAQSVAVQTDGKLVVGGFATGVGGQRQLLVARLTADGHFDPTFANGGAVLKPSLSAGASAEASALALQPDGGIVVAGSDGSQVLVVRFVGVVPTPATPPPANPPENPPVGPALAALSQLRLSPSIFRAANSGGSIARATGTTVRYTDSRAARTTFTVLKRTVGVRRGSRCLKPGRGRRGKRCARYVSVGRFKHSDEVGANSFHFTGRVHHRKLAPGRYRLQGIPSLAGLPGQRATAAFRIVP